MLKIPPFLRRYFGFSLVVSYCPAVAGFWVRLPRDLMRRTSQMIMAMITKMIRKRSQMGQTITVFSTIDSSPKILTVCLARKMPIEGKSQVWAWYLSVSGSTKLVSGSSSLVQISSLLNIGHTCSMYSASV